MKLFCYETENMVGVISTMSKKAAVKSLFAINEDGVAVSDFKEPVSGTIVLDYPLTNPYKMAVDGVKTVGELMWLIGQAYLAVYETEDRTASMVEAWEDPNIVNRGKSNGYYGVWGHSMDELVLEEIEIKDGKIEVFIGS